MDLENMRPFHEVVNAWLQQKNEDIDNAIALATNANDPRLASDLRSIRGKKRPQHDQKAAEFLSRFMELDDTEKSRFMDELFPKQDKVKPTSYTPEAILFNTDSVHPMRLDHLWETAAHSGIKLAVAMRRKGIIPDAQCIAHLVEQWEQTGLYPPKDIRAQYRIGSIISNWLHDRKTPSLATGDLEADRLFEVLITALDINPENAAAIRAQSLKDDNDRVRRNGLLPKYDLFERPHYPLDIPPPPSVPSPQRIPGTELADRIEAYISHLGNKIRPHQHETLQAVIADLRKGNIGGVIKRPTGTGKTVMFSAIATALKPLAEELQAETGQQNSVLILVPTNLLEHQTVETLLEKRTRDGKPFFSSPTNPDKCAITKNDIAIYSDQTTDRQRALSLMKPITVMTFRAYESLLSRGMITPNQFLYTVIDEVDLAKDAAKNADRRTERIRQLTTTGYSSGWSATTKFVTPKKTGDISEALYDRSDYIHTTRIRQAAEKKEVAAIKNIVMVTDYLTKQERKDEESGAPLDEDEIVDIPGRDDAIIENIFRHVDPQTGIAFKDLDQIWFCRGVAHAQTVANRINRLMQSGSQTMPREAMLRAIKEGKTPVYAMSVSWHMPDDTWTDEKGVQHMGLIEILELHRKGKIPVLCNADLLVRGYDSPRTQLAVMTYPSQSDARVEQIGGRIGRLDPDNPHKIGFIVNVFDRDTTHGRIFADDTIAESALIGFDPQQTYKARILHDGLPPRSPNFDMFKRISQAHHIPNTSIFNDPDQVKEFMDLFRKGQWMDARPFTPTTAPPVDLRPAPSGDIENPPRFAQLLRQQMAQQLTQDGQIIDSSVLYTKWIQEKIPDALPFKRTLLKNATAIWNGSFVPDMRTMALLVQRVFPEKGKYQEGQSASLLRTQWLASANELRTELGQQGNGKTGA
jgi:superfamily II DNA or RNA helicase